MCGITGLFNFRRGEAVDPDLLARMTASIAHRGPDDDGMLIDGDIGLGFRRLSIIDLTGGHQPMSDERGDISVVFNGEIYNFASLRRQLEAHGRRFRTRSDTEVIVHGYAQWGVEVLQRLNGMFAVAIWDARRRRLVLARDRAGVKPLYYSVSGGTLLFGSEIRPILAGLGATPEVDAAALRLFLRYRYTPSPLTLHRGVRKLAPGHLLVVGKDGIRDEQWWDFAPEPFDPMPDPDEAIAALLDLYRQAVGRQLVSDVPLGLFLSGGVDSALLLALMREHGERWPTFTVGFGATFPNDELADADATARLLGGDHSTVRIDRRQFEAVLPEIVDIVEEPVASPSTVPMYFVSERARRDVKVALMGQGPDELFGGYTRHLGVRYGHHWRRLPSPARSAAAALLGAVPRAPSLARGVASLDIVDRLERYDGVFALLRSRALDDLLEGDVVAEAGGATLRDGWSDLGPLIADADELSGFSYLELRTSLPDELLLYADKLSMHHGLEVRVPYLDHDVVEFGARLAASLKVRHGERKWVHRRVAARYLPSEVMRRRKRGFGVDVVDGWFRSSFDGRLGAALLSDGSRLGGLVRMDAVSALVAEHAAGRRDHHKILFSLVVLEEWLQNRGPRPAPSPQRDGRASPAVR